MGVGRRAWRGRQRRKNRLAHVRYTYVAGRRESERGIYHVMHWCEFLCLCVVRVYCRTVCVSGLCVHLAHSVSGPLCASLNSFIYII